MLASPKLQPRLWSILQNLSLFSMGNITLVDRDAYLNHLRITSDTLSALRTAPLHIPTLFPDSVIKPAEEEIAHYENKGQAGSSCGKGLFHPYEHQDKRSYNRSDNRLEKRAWKNIGKGCYRKNKRTSNFSPRPAKGRQSYK